MACILMDINYQLFYDFILNLRFFSSLRTDTLRQLKEIVFEKDHQGVLNVEQNLNLFSFVLWVCGFFTPVVFYKVVFPLLQNLFQINGTSHLWLCLNLFAFATQYNILVTILIAKNLHAFSQWFVSFSNLWLTYNILLWSYVGTNNIIGPFIVSLYYTYLTKKVIKSYRQEIEALVTAEEAEKQATVSSNSTTNSNEPVLY